MSPVKQEAHLSALQARTSVPVLHLCIILSYAANVFPCNWHSFTVTLVSVLDIYFGKLHYVGWLLISPTYCMINLMFSFSLKHTPFHISETVDPMFSAWSTTIYAIVLYFLFEQIQTPVIKHYHSTMQYKLFYTIRPAPWLWNERKTS